MPGYWLFFIYWFLLNFFWKWVSVLSMCKLGIKKYFYLPFFVFAFYLFLSPSYPQQGKIYSITLDDDIINPVMAEYVEKAIEKAKNENAECLIIVLDTPGGLLSSTRTIVKSIMNSHVPVIVYVAPSGARAGSAGVFITLAGNIAAMAPSTNIGAAHPVELQEKRSTSDAFEDLMEQLAGKKEKEEKKKPVKQPMEDKILNDTKAWVKTIAEFRGRNERWAVSAVEESVSATEEQALSLGAIDLIASDLTDLKNKIDGREVSLPQGKIKLKTKGLAVIEIPKTIRLKVLAALAHPNIAYILLMLGFYGLLFEFTHPGAGFPGVAGTICLILAFFGLQVLPTNYAGIALIVMAIILFIAEVKVTSYGLLTLGGVISILLGSLILFASPYEFMRVSLPIILAFAVATLAIALFLTTIAVRSQRRKTKTGMEGLIGEVGEVKSWSGNNGKIFVHGEIWDAQSDSDLQSGTRVKIVASDGLKLKVEKEVQEASLGRR
jgi:membrane-bound serine protease (ClpP class)